MHESIADQLDGDHNRAFAVILKPFIPVAHKITAIHVLRWSEGRRKPLTS
jgi:hypothetical protein